MPEFEADSVFVDFDFGFGFVFCGGSLLSFYLVFVDCEIAKGPGNRAGVAEELPG